MRPHFFSLVHRTEKVKKFLMSTIPESATCSVRYYTTSRAASAGTEQCSLGNTVLQPLMHSFTAECPVGYGTSVISTAASWRNSTTSWARTDVRVRHAKTTRPTQSAKLAWSERKESGERYQKSQTRWTKGRIRAENHGHPDPMARAGGRSLETESRMLVTWNESFEHS